MIKSPPSQPQHQHQQEQSVFARSVFEEAKHSSPSGNNINQRSPQGGQGASGLSNGANSQGANLVQTRLNVIDGEFINSRQSQRSMKSADPNQDPSAIEHNANQQDQQHQDLPVLKANGNQTAQQAASQSAQNNDSATYSNSHSYTNSLENINTNSLQGNNNNNAAIDDKRQKKRQRKGEKPRKLQSKVIYKHDENAAHTDPNHSNQNSTSLQVAGVMVPSTAVPSFGAAERLQLQHSSSMIVDRANNQLGLEADVGSKRARLADNSSVADHNSISSIHNTNGALSVNGNRREIEVEVDQLRAELEDTKRQLREKTIEVEKSTQLFTMFDQQIREMQSLLEQNDCMKRLYIDTMIKYLTELEDKNRKERRIFLNEQSIKLGRVSTVRQGVGKVVDMWEEGEAIIKLQTRLREIQLEKEEIDKLKKRAKAHKKAQANGQNKHMMPPPAPVDAYGRPIMNNGLPLMNENSEFDFEESEFNNIDKNEQREIYQFKQKLFENEERRIKEQLQMLEKEKSAYLIEFKRIRDEEQSKYCGIHRSKTFTVLNDKYLILSILGKGGFSEVYKAFDLENCREVACKIHHFDDSWSDQVKDDYIKHALRENEIHKELNNRRVVKHYDTVEIDHNSFSTILELCSGPDLYNYLKENKQIVEKESKLIISQILSGLKYLTDQKQKIIHYDLKPQNIIFHNGEVKITDFGLCKIIEENQDKIELTSQGVGTYWYQAPECFNQSKNPQITQKVDIWSVGVIFYELLFGIKPFGHDKSQMAIVRDQTILNARAVQFPTKPSISDNCKDFIRKCLAYHHQDRYDVYEAYYSPYLRGGVSASSNSSAALSKICTSK